MFTAVDIKLPLAHVGSVNAWLLRGDPLTLVDTGPRDDAALSALEQGLRREGLRIEDIELVLATHHHIDHVGLAATIRRRSGAVVAALDRVADYVGRYGLELEQDRRFSRALMAHHGVPDQVVADNEEFWAYLRSRSEDAPVDVRLPAGAKTPARGPAPSPSGSRTERRSAPAAGRCASRGAPGTARRTRCSSTIARAWRS